MDKSRMTIVQDLTERVALDEYVVDADKVASAILSRLLAKSNPPTPGTGS